MLTYIYNRFMAWYHKYGYIPPTVGRYITSKFLVMQIKFPNDADRTTTRDRFIYLVMENLFTPQLIFRHSNVLRRRLQCSPDTSLKVFL